MSEGWTIGKLATANTHGPIYKAGDSRKDKAAPNRSTQVKYERNIFISPTGRMTDRETNTIQCTQNSKKVNDETVKDLVLLHRHIIIIMEYIT